MQFSRYIMQRTSLQMRLKDSNFNIFHPLQRNTDVKSLCGNTIAPLRYARCTIFLNSNFALLDEVYFFTKIQASLRSL